MKLDKIKFAKLVFFISNRLNLNFLNDEFITDLDALIDIDMPNVASDQVNPSRVDELLKAHQEGKKIEAIKAYRNLTGSGLKESKDAIEKYWPGTNYLDAKTLKKQMLESLNRPECIISFNQHLVREFIESFNEYK